MSFLALCVVALAGQPFQPHAHRATQKDRSMIEMPYQEALGGFCLRWCQKGMTAILLVHSSASEAVQIKSSSSIATNVPVFWEMITRPGLLFWRMKSAK